MKKIVILVSILFIMVGVSSCRSGPQAYVPPPAAPEQYRTVFIDLVYDPILLITHDEKLQVIEDLQSRVHEMGFGIATSQDRADMTLRITIDELLLAGKNERLLARSTFGLVKDEAFMAYTASFIDNGTFDEITSRKGRLKTTKVFASHEEIKTKFFSEMEDDILKFMSESKDF